MELGHLVLAMVGHYQVLGAALIAAVHMKLADQVIRPGVVLEVSRKVRLFAAFAGDPQVTLVPVGPQM